MSYEFSLNQGIIQHTSTFDGVHYVDANRNAMLTGPITLTGTMNVDGNLYILNDLDVQGELNINGNGSITIG